MDNLILGIAARAADGQAPEPGDYFNESGLLVCGNCDTPRQTAIELSGKQAVVWCLCACREAAWKENQQDNTRRQAALRAERIQESAGGQGVDLDCTFDDLEDSKALEVCRRYVQHWAEVQAENMGLLLYGPPGTGKTTAAAAVANALRAQGIAVTFVSVAKAVNSGGFDKSALLDAARAADLLILDDLGARRNTTYARSVEFAIVDARYQAGKPMLCTTNLSLDELRAAGELEEQRTFSRVLELCTPVLFDGPDRRTTIAAAKRQELRAILLDNG